MGLAPVSGMCDSQTSCTVSEGNHFESVFVIAHEFGHNLGQCFLTLGKLLGILKWVISKVIKANVFREVNASNYKNLILLHMDV